jgi:hypothetical protein
MGSTTQNTPKAAAAARKPAMIWPQETSTSVKNRTWNGT